MRTATEGAALFHDRLAENAVMKQVAVYASERRSNAVRKESLVYDSIDLAFDAFPDVDWQRRAMPATSAPSLPGLIELRSHEKVVALGRTAHSLLADYRKHTLVAGDEDEGLEEDVERLVWSCVNTSKIVALGSDAWRSVQMLPIAERRFYEMPPLRMAPPRAGAASAGLGHDVLVINHEADGERARQVAEALVRGGYGVQSTGLGDEGGLDDGGWSAAAAIHVHVGSHDSQAEEMRLLDTWHSRRFAILLLPRRLLRNPPPGTILVDADVDGFLCDSPDKVLAACADLRADAVLRKKMLHAGATKVAPLARQWVNIATELFS